MGHDELGGGLAELDVADWILEDGKFLAGTAGLPVLADGRLSEFDLATVWVAVDVNVGDAHCCGGNVYIAVLLFDSVVGVPKSIRSWCAWCCSSVRKLIGKRVVNCGVVEDVFIWKSQRVDVSLRSQGQIVIALVALFGGRETWRQHVCSGCRLFNRDRVKY